MTHGVITEPSLNDHIGKGREGNGKGSGVVVLHATSLTEGAELPAFKRCPKCVTDRPVKEFWRSTSRKDGMQALCKSCINASVKALRAVRPRGKESPEAKRIRLLRYKYGLTVEDFDAMLEAQGGVCAICGNPESQAHMSGGVPRLAVDHDHATGAIRGLLCNSCNRGLGCYFDDPERMRSAAAYLEAHADSTQAPMQKSDDGGVR